MIFMHREISAGGIVWNSKTNKILLIKDSYGRWALPKGFIEKDETSEQAAIREVQEETGLKNLKILEKLGEIKYYYQLKGEKIFKIVIFFLMETEDIELKHEWEVKEAQWLEPQEALEKLEYENSKSLLSKAIEKLRK